MAKRSFSENIKYWINGSKEDFQIAQSLARLKHYPQCLFFCHLSVEKLLKAIVIETINDFAPYTHDLRKLAKIADLKPNLKQKRDLEKIFTFNIAGRYADAKLDFYKKYNKKEHAQKYLKITEDLIIWLKKEFQKKLSK